MRFPVFHRHGFSLDSIVEKMVWTLIQAERRETWILRNEARELTLSKEGEVQTISWDDFTKVELRVGSNVSAAPFPVDRKPAYLLQVDFGGEIGMKKASAQITHLYQPDELEGKLIVAVVNFPP